MDNSFHMHFSLSRLTTNLQKLSERNPDLAALIVYADSCLEKYMTSVQKSDKTAGSSDKNIIFSPEPPEATKLGAVQEEITLESSNFEHSEESVESPVNFSPEKETFPAGSDISVMSDAEIEQLEKRLLLKIEASLWALERDKLIREKADFTTKIEPFDHDLLSRARELTNCYLWMNNPETAPIVATENYELLSQAYAAAAMCVHFLRQITQMVDKMPEHEILRRILRDALYTTATAQSVLRRITVEISGRNDQDQIRLHRWLTQLTQKYHIFVNRHMKKDSLASISRVNDIPEIIKRLQEQVDKIIQKQNLLTQGFQTIRSHASKIQKNPQADESWEQIIDTVEQLLKIGVRTNDSRLQELLGNIIPLLPEAPNTQEHPFFAHFLLDMNYWTAPEKVDDIYHELHAMHYFSQISPNLIDEYTNIDLDSDLQMQNDETPSFQDFLRDNPPPKRNMEALHALSSSLYTAISSAMGDSHISPVFSPEILEKYPSEKEREILTSARNSIKNRIIFWIDSEDPDTFRQEMEQVLHTSVIFIKATNVQSENCLLERFDPQGVGIILMAHHSFPQGNPIIENFCRRFDIPCLRLEENSSLVQIARQITAALSLYN
ncbi:MAG: hypothetical protein Q4C96_09680 [Planctomycetia bacterium]|nr:hypothetical protein [Planctomycetia bacterium]